jgi:uncharacterized sulfatase
MQNAKPNIVIVLADDLGRSDVGCYGNTVVRTPHIDRLAREGMRLDNAFTAEAICSPSRSTLYTGLYPVRHGCHMNHGSVKSGVRSLAHYLKPLGYRVALAGKVHVKPAEAFPFEHFKGGDVERFLRSVGREEPFCLVYASNEPHGPHRSGGYDPARIPLPPTLVDTPELRRNMADYYTDIDVLDREVGDIHALLEKHGRAGDTLTLFTSDHGPAWFAKWTLYDAGLHVPFIAHWPGVIKPGSRSDVLLSFVDVLPTCIEAAGGASPQGVDGRSFLPVLSGKTQEHRDVVFGTHTNRGVFSGSTYPIRAVRTRTHKYIRNLDPDGVYQNILTHGRSNRPEDASPVWKSWQEKAKTDPFAAERVRWFQHRPAEELYDLRSDPHEMKNLAGDPAQRPRLEQMRRMLDDWMAQQGDQGLRTELTVPLSKSAAGGND